MPPKSESDKLRFDLTKAADWRRRAVECRVELETMTDPAARRSMMLIAKFYDRLAKQHETQPDSPSGKMPRGPRLVRKSDN